MYLAKYLKDPKLSKFSPNKTYAGMIGGYLLSILSAIILNNFYFGKELPINSVYFCNFIISSISQLGDIIISYFKRLSKIKDTGKIIPGHGGLLDRADGMIFAFPIFLFNYFNKFFINEKKNCYTWINWVNWKNFIKYSSKK